ncbi:hypothetical protein F4693_000143 [Sphingomonas endophytica]|uniref:Uncharacterized protein n=1 Tax=Sphingomonas endophytica TaxID=869719 RepID=A0A7X0MLF6_9SPHN|nr:hypothetical protein [Sphingomonas endophytica]MBB6503194.1 hypothetical protein [Sphingomonas endophytica]
MTINEFTAFKHTKASFAADMRQCGRIRLASLTYYRSLEGAAKDVEDPLEGTGLVDLSGHYPPPSGGGYDLFIGGEDAQSTFQFIAACQQYPDLKGRDLVVAAIRESFGIDASESNIVIDVSGITLVQECPPLYVFSMSLRDDAGMFDNPDTLDVYDTVVTIPDYRRLADAILEYAPSIEQVTVAKVIYEPRSITAAQGNLLVHPFRKDTRFAWQEEVRLIAVPNGTISDHLFVEGPNIAKAFGGD